MMDEAIDFYKQQALNLNSNTSWLVDLQKKSLVDFCEAKFPSRGNEDWKYTSIDSFLKQRFIQKDSAESLTKHALEVVATSRQTDAPVGIKIPLINGVAIGLDNIAGKLPDGVIIETIACAIESHKDKIKPYLGQILQHSNGFQSLNTAMLELGLFIYIPENICVPEPLLLTHLQTEEMGATFLRHLIVAKKGSEVSIIEDYQGDMTACYFTNTVTEIFVDESASVKHFKTQRESKKSFHFGHVAAKQLANSQFATHLFNLGSQWSRCDATIDLEEKLAKCLLNAVYMPVSTQHMDSQTTVNHITPNCYSEQDYKGIVNDSASAVFNGRVFVAKGAKLTEAKQQNKNLLLSNAAVVYTKPQLDIYSDDVICTHGATVGELDKEALFYFLTRGIDEDDARSYLLQAFVASNIQMIANNSLAAWILGLLIQQMG